jgi:uncharacterized protein with WD repeat
MVTCTTLPKIYCGEHWNTSLCVKKITNLKINKSYYINTNRQLLKLKTTLRITANPP